MGAQQPEEVWRKRVEAVVDELCRLLRIDTVIVFGSWARSGGGEWSDVDVLVVSNDAERIPFLERFRITASLRRYQADVFIYSLRELERMVERCNPLALSALIEDIPCVQR